MKVKNYKTAFRHNATTWKAKCEPLKCICNSKVEGSVCLYAYTVLVVCLGEGGGRCHRTELDDKRPRVCGAPLVYNED